MVLDLSGILTSAAEAIFRVCFVMIISKEKRFPFPSDSYSSSVTIDPSDYIGQAPCGRLSTLSRVG